MNPIQKKMEVMLGMPGYNFVKVDETKIHWSIDTKNILLIDFTFSDPDLWELQRKEQSGTKTYDWVKSQAVSPKIRGCISTMLKDFEAAILYYQEDAEDSEEEPVDTQVDVIEDDDVHVITQEDIENCEEEEKKRILAKIQLEENKRKLQMMEEAEQEEAAANPPKTPDVQHKKKTEPAIFSDRPVKYVAVPVQKKGEVDLLDTLCKICQNDLMQIYGGTGTGKTSICTKLALDARSKNKSVLYIDTEGSINDDQIEAMKKTGTKYEFAESFVKLCEAVNNLPKVDVLLIDSAGVPALASYCKTHLGGQGEILKKFIAMADDLKKYARRNNALVVVINQPESSMGKTEDAILEPWGEKSRYYFKEILKTDYAKGGRTPEQTTLVLRAHRSRCMGIDKVICTIIVTDSGIKAVV